MNPRITYYLFHALHVAGFTGTVTAYTPFLRSIGLSLGDIALVNVAYWVTVILMELPTGLLADGRGRAWSIKMGVTIHGLGALVYFTAQGFWTALLGEVVVGVGGAFISGALGAWITDALHRRGEWSERRHVFGTAAIWRGVAALGAGLIGAWVGSWSLRGAWLLDASFFAAAGFVAYYAMHGQGEPLERITEREAFRQSFRLLCRRPALQWGIVASMLLGLVVPFNHYWSLYFRETVGQQGLGVIWVIIYITMTISGLLVRRTTVPQGNEGGLIAMVLIVTGVGLAGMGLVSGLGLPILFLVMHEIGRGLFDPLMESFTQHRVESSYRATYGSLHSLLGRLGFAITLIGVWLGTRGLPNTLPTMQGVLLLCGVLLAASAFVLWVLRPNSKA